MMGWLRRLWRRFRGRRTIYKFGPIEAVWNCILTPEQIEALSKGADPTFIKPKHLVYYYPFRRQAEEETEPIHDAFQDGFKP